MRRKEKGEVRKDSYVIIDMYKRKKKVRKKGRKEEGRKVGRKE
jgi:hypothetical protein